MRADRACDALLFAFAFVLPLSIAATDITLIAALVCWLVTRPWSRPWPRGLVVLLWASVGLLASWLLSTALSSAPLASLVEVRKLYAIAALFLAADRVRAHGTAFALRLALTALGGGVLSALFGLSGFAVRRFVESVAFYRLEGVFSTAMTSGNVFATLAVAAVGVVLLPEARPRARWFAAAAAAVFMCALVATLTRSSWLAFGAGMVVLLGAVRARWLVAATAALVVGLLIAPPEWRERFTSIADPTNLTNAGRISLWKSGWVAFTDRPIAGWGLQDMLDLILRYRRPDYTFVAGHHHNNWVQIAVSTGIVGLLAFAFWMGAAAAPLIAGLRSPERRWAALGLAVWLAFQVHGLFDWSFGDAEVVDQLYLWLGLAMGAASLAGAPGSEAGSLQHASARRGV